MELFSTTNIAVGTRLLLELWSRLNGPGRAVEIEKNWEPLLDACDYHQVSPIVFHRLRSQPDQTVPAELLNQLRGRFYRISAYNHRLAMLLAELAVQLEEQRIPCLALKGPTAAVAIYGDLSLRQYEDLDIMVRPEDAARTVEFLFSCGFQPVRDHRHRYKNVKLYHEITLLSPDQSYGLDLHWLLGPPYAAPFGPDLRELWSRAGTLSLPGGPVPVLCREDLFLTLCQHGTRHRWWQLKWLFDIGEMLRNPTTMDWPQIDNSLQQRPMGRQAAGLAILLARDLLGVRILAEIEKIFPISRRTHAVARAIQHEFLTNGQNNGSAHDTLLGLEPRPLARARYLAVESVQYPVRAVLFTITPKDLEFVYLPERLHPLYYFIRPFRLMFQHGRGAARRIWSLAR
jgi:hypothetical protein